MQPYKTSSSNLNLSFPFIAYFTSKNHLNFQIRLPFGHRCMPHFYFAKNFKMQFDYYFVFL